MTELEKEEAQRKIKIFADSQFRELKENSLKGFMGRDCSIEYLLADLSYHYGKFQLALSVNNKEAMREYASDVANYLLFIGDRFELWESEFSLLPENTRIVLNKENLFLINTDSQNAKKNFT